ncbi:rod shape-determining protein MreD [Anoxybacterium hadale]|uniref:rod shape-determining protein MreD n=1 Tax=Anoxybacterium hadale TaxID=3408580 RepID=UPI003AFFF9A5
MKYRYSFLLFFIAFLLQTTVLNHFGIFGMSPNLILCLVVIFSFLFEGYHGIIYGLLFGLFVDICFAQIIGIASIGLFSIALICSELKRYLYKESVVSIVIVSLVSTTVYGLMYWGIYRMLGNGFDFLYVAEKEAILLGYHAVVTLIIYHFVSKSFKHRSDRYMYRGNLQEARSLYRS